jgi:hypothetical protein
LSGITRQGDGGQLVPVPAIKFSWEFSQGGTDTGASGRDGSFRNTGRFAAMAHFLDATRKKLLPSPPVRNPG